MTVAAVMPQVFFLCTGCRSGAVNKPVETPAVVDWSANWSEPAPKLVAKPKEKSPRKRRRKKKSDALDDLWRQGYGFNNPNAERLRTGEPTEPFATQNPFDDDEDDGRRRPYDRQYDPLYNESLRDLYGNPW